MTFSTNCQPLAVTPAEGPAFLIFVHGRVLWALRQLMAAGSQGCTPIDQPAPRWAAYVHKLRRMGVDVETLHEPHGPPFAGYHARYVLRSRVEPVLRSTGAAA